MAGNKDTRPKSYPGSWNNPGNIVYSKKVTHPGQNGSVKGKVSGNTFLTFDTPQNGLNAMGSTVGQIIREKIPQRFASGELPDSRFNIENFVKVYAPKKDNNDTDEYIRFVSDKMGVGAKDDLDPADGTRMAKLLETLVRRESGHGHADWFTPEEYSSAAGKVAATRQDAKGGDTRADTRGGDSGVPEGRNAALDGYSGPRIVINPSTFKNEKDALCVAFDEGFRILMEHMGFECVSEPTEEQRRFFSDTSYADDEVQLRRTILARICTLDTSIKDPTDEQLQEAVEFLDSVLEAGVTKNEWEQRAVQRIRDLVSAIPPSSGRGDVPKDTPKDTGTVEAAVGGGDTDEDKKQEDGTVQSDAEVGGQSAEHIAEWAGEEKTAAESGGNDSQPAGADSGTGAGPGADKDWGNVSITIGSSVGISDTGTKDAAAQKPGDTGAKDAAAPKPGDTGAKDATAQKPGDTDNRGAERQGSIRNGLQADNPANRLNNEGVERQGSIRNGLHADNPANRLESQRRRVN